MIRAAAVRLLCLPYSGASAAIYGRWRAHLPSTIVVTPIELPGRGSRMAEPLCVDPHALTTRLAEEIGDLVSGPGALPYALFGHSLGALLAFELAHALTARGAPAPLALFASGSEAPARRDDSGFRQARSDAELIADLRARKGTPEEALADSELMALVLPVLRADFLMCGAYAHRSPPALPCPVQALGGWQDDVAPDDLAAWGLETEVGFDLAMFEGGHFFLHSQQPQVLRLLGDRISALARTRRVP